MMISSCSSNNTNNAVQTVADPNKMDAQLSIMMRQLIQNSKDNQGKIDDSLHLNVPQFVEQYYIDNDYPVIWSHSEKWSTIADSLFNYLQNAELYGLFPADYQQKKLANFKNVLDTDSLKRMQPLLWARAELLLTDGFFKLVHDLKYGRLQADSNWFKIDSSKTKTFYFQILNTLKEKQDFNATIKSIQPKHKGYWDLLSGIKRFVDSMDRKSYTYITYPYKKSSEKDSLIFIKTFTKRLAESKCIDAKQMPDTTSLMIGIKKYQQLKGLKQDGLISTALINILNTSDPERFKRIAITLDRYKLMPDKMPEQYVWVNLPGYYLKVWDHDTIALESKVICGKPSTPTPILNSVITNMVTYPTWTVPTSIIAKQYLPKLKNNPNYLSKLGLRLINGKGQTIDPGSVNWSKYNKGIPYSVMQASGDNNALGVMKFNFDNPHAVYLHDTNQRYLFKNASRAYSHGCVRVQEWEQLANYFARNDSLNLKPGDTLRYNADSIKNWIAAKSHKRISIKNGIPLFIAYYSCEGINGKIKFYEDIYGDDKQLRQRFFSKESK
ncbi:MAG: L,D-transpeptidase family protein [Ferruginibacter sp.]